MVLLILLVLSLIIIGFFCLNQRLKLSEELKQKLENYKSQINNFFTDYYDLKNHYICKNEKNNFIEKWENLYSELTKYRIPNDNAYDEIRYFIKTFEAIDDNVSILNNCFIKNESSKYDYLFSNIDGKSLDSQQREAVITDEDNTLVLAGAGSGKTLTIAAKVKYLCEIRHINPQDILLISFTRKSSQEMTDRIQGKLGIQATATTFHKLGLDIIKAAEGIRPDVSDDNGLNQFVHNFFENELLNHQDLIQALTDYFTYYLDIPENIENYASLGELYEAEKAADFETLKSKYTIEKYIKQNEKDRTKAYTSLNNEKVRSLEEVKIANYLFMHGVNYEYERLYPYKNNDPLHKAYRPDFYLTDYDIYLEHFGITKNFTVPWLSEIEARKYIDGIYWKRALHKEQGTKLIETYSYYNSEGILFKKLEEILLENGVKFNEKNYIDIFNTVYGTKSTKYFSEFINLCCTFITLFKSNGYSIDYIENLRKNYFNEEPNSFLRERTTLFLKIIKIILTKYQNYLAQNNIIDFSDMINKATTDIISGCSIPNYKYIIVDEYQDISKSRFNLLKAIADRNKSKVFCVGDDWQSIYRFAGSDISLFTEFEKYLGYTKVLKIEKTYRNSQNLINEASRFILKNPNQLKKELFSDKKLDYPLVFWGFNENPRQALQGAINKIISGFGEHSSILLLGRTNFDFDIIKESGLFKINKNNIKYIPYPNLKIDFLTVHKAKGLEVDNVIILNFKDDKLGFPNQIADDKILNLVLTKAENYSFAEERRIFYVAITRTKNRTFILTDNTNPSQFFNEFSESKSVCFVAINKKDDNTNLSCPRCKTGTLIRFEHNGTSFAGCSNYPKCRYTVKDVSILSNPRRCPVCGGFLVKRKAKNGYWFSGCTNYPYCNYTEQ